MINPEKQRKFTHDQINGNLSENHNLMINKWNLPLATGFKLEREYSYTVEHCFIIAGLNDSASIESAERFHLQYEVNESFNILDNMAKLSGQDDYKDVVVKNIVAPKKYAGAEWLNHLKVANINLTYRQVTRLLNHIAIWEQCIRDQQPVIILEASAKLYLEHVRHLPRSSIISLDSGIDRFHQHNTNFASMNNPHAYSIDHFSAKRLFNDVMKNGLIEPLERHFRIDKYLIIPENKATKI
jgi:hypothetical protein